MSQFENMVCAAVGKRADVWNWQVEQRGDGTFSAPKPLSVVCFPSVADGLNDLVQLQSSNPPSVEWYLDVNAPSSAHMETWDSFWNHLLELLPNVHCISRQKKDTDFGTLLRYTFWMNEDDPAAVEFYL